MSSLNHNESSFWSTRKLLISYRLLSLPAKTKISLKDLAFPFNYPKSSLSDSWETFRIFWCLIHLKGCGVKVTKLSIDSSAVLINHLPDTALLPSNPGSLKNIVSGPFVDHLTPSGDGDFLLPQLSEIIKNQLILPGCFKYAVEIDRTKLRKALYSYLKLYRQGKLHHKKNTFGHAFMKRLFDKFWKLLIFRQGDNFKWSLGYSAGKSGLGHDEFIHTFQRNFRHEYQLWYKGRYQLRVFEYILASHSAKEIQLKGIDSWTNPIDLQDEISLKDYCALHSRPIEAVFSLKLVPPKKKTSVAFWRKSISKIEIVPSDHGQFWIYLNENHNEPIIMNKSSKTGKLWYQLAQDGAVPLAKFRSSYQYITTDKRFKFFSKTNYSFQKLLELDEDEYILPVPQVTVTIKE